MNSMDLQEIEQLIQKRDSYRKTGKYAEADSIRKQLEDSGIELIDEQNRTVIKKPVHNKSEKSFLVLFGSGEIASTGRLIHEYVFKKLNKKGISIAIITTPAGFENNVSVVHQEIADFFLNHLTNYHPLVKIIYANTRKETEDPSISDQLNGVDYIFLGPGSPTYAVQMLKNSQLMDKIVQCYQNGSSLCLASAATIAFSKYCLPVYEIYKAGHPLEWLDGLNFYKQSLGRELSIIPHFNNTDGGQRLDTTCCFMGKDRFDKLIKLLPSKNNLIGIDEHTAVIFEPQDDSEVVMGKGNIHHLFT